MKYFLFPRLRPCPHCGATRIRICRIAHDGKRLYFGECTGCRWCGETRRTKWAARKAWNTGSSAGTSGSRTLAKALFLILALLLILAIHTPGTA